MVTGNDQVVLVAFGLCRAHVDRVRGTPGRQVVLKILVGLPILDLDLDPVDTTGGTSGAVDGEGNRSLLDPTLDRVRDRGLVGAGDRLAGEVIDRDPADVRSTLGRGVTTGDEPTWGDEHRLVAFEGVRHRAPLERLARRSG